MVTPSPKVIDGKPTKARRSSSLSSGPGARCSAAEDLESRLGGIRRVGKRSDATTRGEAAQFSNHRARPLPGRSVNRLGKAEAPRLGFLHAPEWHLPSGGHRYRAGAGA